MILPGLFLLVSTLSFQERTAIKETLPNGAALYLQRIKGANTFSIVFASVPKSEPESPETHGVRHLAEHLVARGAKKTIDQNLERAGLVLVAETTRDAMTFQVSGPTMKLSDVLDAVPELLQGFEPTVEDIAREIGIMEQELALRRWDLAISSDGWLKAYGDRAVDPFGDIEKLRSLSLDDVKSAVSRLFRSEAVCATLIGDFELEPQARRLRDLLATLGKGATEVPWNRARGSGPVRVGSSDGEGVCIPIGPFNEQSSLALIGASLGIRAWISGSSVLVNPSARSGMVTVALPVGSSWGANALRFKGRESLVAQTGLVVLRSWLTESANDSARLAKIGAVLLPLNPSFDPQLLGSLANLISLEEVTSAVKMIFATSGAGL